MKKKLIFSAHLQIREDFKKVDTNSPHYTMGGNNGNKNKVKNSFFKEKKLPFLDFIKIHTKYENMNPRPSPGVEVLPTHVL